MRMPFSAQGRAGGGEYAHSIDVFPVVPCDYMKQTEDRGAPGA